MKKAKRSTPEEIWAAHKRGFDRCFASERNGSIDLAVQNMKYKFELIEKRKKELALAEFLKAKTAEYFEDRFVAKCSNGCWSLSEYEADKMVELEELIERAKDSDNSAALG